MFKIYDYYLGVLSNNLDIYSLSNYPTNPYSLFYNLDANSNTLFGALFSYFNDIDEWVLGTSYIQKNFLPKDISSLGFSFLNNLPFILGILICGANSDGNLIGISKNGVALYKPEILLASSSINDTPDEKLAYYDTNFKIGTITTHNYIPFLSDGIDTGTDYPLYLLSSHDFSVILKYNMLSMMVINKKTNSVSTYQIPKDMQFSRFSIPPVCLKNDILYIFNYNSPPLVGLDLNTLSIKLYPLLSLPKLADEQSLSFATVFDTGAELLLIYNNENTVFYDIDDIEYHSTIASVSYSLTQTKKIYYEDILTYTNFHYYMFQTANGSVIFGGNSYAL